MGEGRYARRGERQPTYIVIGSILCFVACALLIIAFCSPNWLQRNRRVFSTMRKIGLWEVCFDGFWDRELSMNNYEEFERDGYLVRIYADCRWVFNWDLERIRVRLVPNWFMAVQGFATLGLVTSMLATIINISMLCFCCMTTRISCLYAQSFLLFASFCCNSVAISVFAAKALDELWMPNSYWNHFGFAYVFCVIGAVLGFVAGVFMYSQAAKERRRSTEPKSMPFESYEPGRYNHPMTTSGSYLGPGGSYSTGPAGSYSTGPSHKTTPSGSVDTDV